MNDPIADIIYKALYNEISPRPMLAESTAKQIRQQIGRELLTQRNLFNHISGDNFVREDVVREICKLDDVMGEKK